MNSENFVVRRPCWSCKNISQIGSLAFRLSLSILPFPSLTCVLSKHLNIYNVYINFMRLSSHHSFRKKKLKVTEFTFSKQFARKKVRLKFTSCSLFDGNINSNAWPRTHSISEITFNFQHPCCLMP